MRKRGNIRIRRQSGQGLAEGVAGTLLLTMVFVGLLILGLNTFFAATYSSKVQTVATEAAKVVTANKYWLGMERPDYDKGDVAAKAERIADNLAETLGLPPISDLEVEEYSTEDADVINVHVTVSGLRLPLNMGILPSAIKLSAEGVSVQPKQSVYAMIHISAPTHHDPRVHDTVAIPAFGFFRDTTFKFGGTGVFGPHKTKNLRGDIGEIGKISGSPYFRGLPLPEPTHFHPGVSTPNGVAVVDTH